MTLVRRLELNPLSYSSWGRIGIFELPILKMENELPTLGLGSLCSKQAQVGHQSSSIHGNVFLVAGDSVPQASRDPGDVSSSHLLLISKCSQSLEVWEGHLSKAAEAAEAGRGAHGVCVEAGFLLPLT